MSSRLIVRCLALAGAAVAFAVVTACGSSGSPGALSSILASRQAKGAHSAAPHKAAPRAAGGEMVAAVGSDKGGLPIEVHFALRQRPEVGRPVELDIEVTPLGPIGRLVTSFHAEDGLAIEKGGSPEESDRPEPGVPLSRSLTIVAQRDGIFYVNATVLVDSGADSVARTFTIPVIAGEGTT